MSVLEADTDPRDYFSLFIFFFQIITGVDVSVSCPCLCPCLIGLSKTLDGVKCNLSSFSMLQEVPCHFIFEIEVQLISQGIFCPYRCKTF